MFEVGKKYVHEGRVVKILFLTEESAMVQIVYVGPKQTLYLKVGQELLWRRKETEPFWVEEPKVTVNYTNVYKDSLGAKLGSTYCNEFAANDYAGNERIALLKFTLTDGKDLQVEIIKKAM